MKDITGITADTAEAVLTVITQWIITGHTQARAAEHTELIQTAT
jgi:hypothetical protein